MAKNLKQTAMVIAEKLQQNGSPLAGGNPETANAKAMELVRQKRKEAEAAESSRARAASPPIKLTQTRSKTKTCGPGNCSIM